MCEALQQLMQKSFKNGEAEGIRKGELQGELRGKQKGGEIGELRGEIKGMLLIMKEYGSTKDNAVGRLLLRYPKEEHLILQLADQIFTAE